MTRARQDGLYLLLLGSLMFVLVGSALVWLMPGALGDFKSVYYSSRCLLEHRDPYQGSEVHQVYESEEAEPLSPIERSRFEPPVRVINVPTSFIFSAPFAILPWKPAYVLWVIFTAVGFIVATFLIWKIGASPAPVISGALMALLLANSVSLFYIGNFAGIVVSLSAIAAWSFLQERFVLAGVLCLAAALAIKPHDASVVWLYFLLAGGAYRRRALQSASVVVVLSLSAVLWVSHFSPHWMLELDSNLAASAAHGDINDPGPTNGSSNSAAMVIDLQSVISVFRNDSRIYNPVSYLICGSLLLIWTVRTLKSSYSQAKGWLALATIAPLTMLVTYHRPYDAKLLLLAVPACAMLWAEGGLVGWFALLLTLTGIVMTGDFPLTAIVAQLSKSPHANTSTLSGKILTVVMARPAPLILLILGIFYLWVYVRRTGPDTERDSSTERDSRGPEGLALASGR